MFDLDDDAASLLDEFEIQEQARVSAADKADSPGAANDFRLAQALDDAIAARAKIPAEQAKILAKMAAFQPLSVEFEKLAYDHDIVALQLNRAADVAEQRRAHLAKIQTPAQKAAEKAKCANGIDGLLHWVYYYAWTADPRPDSPLYTVPFAPFEFQEDGFEWLWNLIYETRTDGTIDKSRDMGVSWMVVAFGSHQWSFAPKSAPFLALYGSRKEDFVDKRGDMDTLFEKIRFVIDRLPAWQLPDGWNPGEHDNFMRILNPETGSTLKGESSNDDFGRGGRQTVIFFDEHASFPGGGYAAWTAASESTRSRIGVSTPKGKFNKFAEIRHDDTTPALSMHWKKHPWKDARWYEWQKTRMDAVEIAQELDLDYEGSQAGRLLPMWDERIHVITWSEFAKYFGKNALDEHGVPRIPPDWQIGWAHDVGTTEDHPAVLTMAATAAENTPLPGHVFLFKELIIPVDGTPLEFTPLIRAVADPWNLWANLTMSLISHEGNSERLTYETLGVHFEAWDTEQGYTQGYSQLQVYLTPDKSRTHPFRPHLQIHGQPVGCPKMFVIVADNQGGLVPHDVDGVNVWKSRPALKDDKEQQGFKRARLEIPGIHIPQSEQGKPARARRHFKKLDDAFDTWRALAAQFFPAPTEKTAREKMQERLAPELKGERFAETVQADPNGAIYGYADARERVRQEMDEEERPQFGGTAARLGRARKQMQTVRNPRGKFFNVDNTTLYFEDDDD